jgi:hypothetical protein
MAGLCQLKLVGLESCLLPSKKRTYWRYCSLLLVGSKSLVYKEGKRTLE